MNPTSHDPNVEVVAFDAANKLRPNFILAKQISDALKQRLPHASSDMTQRHTRLERCQVNNLLDREIFLEVITNKGVVQFSKLEPTSVHELWDVFISFKYSEALDEVKLLEKALKD